jgi:hypothetical protein
MHTEIWFGTLKVRDQGAVESILLIFYGLFSILSVSKAV